jgi:hypothetical protein
MKSNLTNLLSRDRIRTFHRDYFFRLATVGIVGISLVMVINMLLLLPVYMYVHGQVTNLQTRLTGIDQSTKTTEEQDVATRLHALQTNAAYLVHTKSIPQASALLTSLLTVPRVGISLTSFSLSRGTDGKNNKLVMGGTALTRESLQNYAQLLGRLPYVSSVDLPISSYAQESNIQFTITLTGTLAP